MEIQYKLFVVQTSQLRLSEHIQEKKKYPMAQWKILGLKNF